MTGYRVTQPVSAARMQWDAAGVDMIRMPALENGAPLPGFVTAEQIAQLLASGLIEQVPA